MMLSVVQNQASSCTRLTFRKVFLLFDSCLDQSFTPSMDFDEERALHCCAKVKGKACVCLALSTSATRSPGGEQSAVLRDDSLALLG